MSSEPSSNGRLSWSETLRSDVPASIIVFLVALPLCMGIAIASGAPPAAGLITGIVGGLVVGFLAGSPLQVSGPAAGLFVIVAEIIRNFGTVDGEFNLTRGMAAMGIAVLAAGLIQFVAGVLKFGGLFRAVSPAVIQGMLSGIGVLILASQFHVMVDDKNAAKPYVETWGKGLANLITIPASFMKGVVPLDGSPHHLAAAIGVGTILILALWKFIPIKQLKIIPAPVVAVTAATIVAAALGLTHSHNVLAERKADPASTAGDGGRVKITQVDVPDNLTDGILLPTRESLSLLLTPAMLIAALTIALVASAETMLCCTAVDQMQSHVRTDYDRELWAQGVGNMICGALGVLPMTGVIVRSAANVDAGGRTRLSAILHGVWLLVLVAAVPWVLNYIPMAALAAVLVFTGWKLINPWAIAKLFQVRWIEGAICVLTLSLVVGVDLLTGVLTGIAVAAARLLWRFTRLKIEVDNDSVRGRVIMRLSGAATFLALPRLTALLDRVSPDTELHVHLEDVTYVDHAVLEQFVNWEKQHEANGGRLVIDWDDLTATFTDSEKRNGKKRLARAVFQPARKD
ncbi:C4-dicarboxylic acid transporter DauA [Pirellulimonas nuda]|uniref:C4-dicarboxylic acid transporter DauA n=1 Tax=Pirellulimonas nuda TaxID=2528009 RepID=A0A518D800_9BACT|nr:SulP family inorganic anion transporter [Pirellulimonas nuda]QDU87611.1 C4-dicarboxylic acid transporter DauA [Pirellulimonas nuda]